MTEERIRYTLSCIDEQGLRVRCGQHIYDTREEADEQLRAMLTNPWNSPDTLRQLFGDTDLMAVRAIPCWPNSGDPKAPLILEDGDR